MSIFVQDPDELREEAKAEALTSALLLNAACNRYEDDPSEENRVLLVAAKQMTEEAKAKWEERSG